MSLLVLGLLVKRKTKLDFRLGVMPLFTLARSGVLFLFIVTRASVIFSRGFPPSVMVFRVKLDCSKSCAGDSSCQLAVDGITLYFWKSRENLLFIYIADPSENRKSWVLAEITEKEYCQAKKVCIKFNVLSINVLWLHFNNQLFNSFLGITVWNFCFLFVYF